MNNQIQPVTLCGSRTVNSSWFKKCIESWKNLHNVAEFVVMDDGSLKEKDIKFLESFNLKVISAQEIEQKVIPLLKPYKNLKNMRSKVILYRKLLDPTLLFCSSNRILFVDSDVFFAQPFNIPSDIPDFLFPVDETSGYSGSWHLPIHKDMVWGLNSGFILYRPDQINIDLLDSLVSQYLLLSSCPWWSEQSAWSLIAGMINNKGVFDSQDVRCISGLAKRTTTEIIKGKSKWIGGSNQPIQDTVRLTASVEGATVIHFAGPGKRLIENFANPLPKSKPSVHSLKWLPIKNASLWERFLLAIRIGITELRYRSKKK